MIFSDFSKATTGLLLFATSYLLYVSSNKKEAKKTENRLRLTAANFHFTRKCNYNCGFCFHTAKNSHVESLENCKVIIRALRDQGCKKINFAGGEPFLPDYTSNAKKNTDLGEMVKFAKVECGFEAVSIISNGRYITEKWMKQYHEYLDVLGVSCDSANDSTNKAIGRGNGQHVDYVRQAAALCRQFRVPFKLNTVVCSHNWEEDLSELLAETGPMRWKIFQVLGLNGENTGADTKRDVTPFLISEEQFHSYVERHQRKIPDPSVMKVEDNDTMKASYVLVDEYGRFLDSSTGGKVPTRSILDVGVEAAWAELEASAGGGFDQQAFDRRDGNFFDSTVAGPGSGCAECSVTGGGAHDVVDIEDLLLGH